ncbi:MAG: BON domain-containing protein [Acidobacteria bacterium]|nr:BON domain-containing protein [Acidobacteriota bacterium]
MNRKPILVMAMFTFALLLDPVVARADDDTSGVQELADTVQGLAVRAMLVDRLGVDAVRINVSVSGREALLSGTVPNVKLKRMAPDAALSVRGVTIVRNEIEVVNGPGAIHHAERELRNAALAIKVRAALFAELGRTAMTIDVDAVDGVVTLRGSVDTPGMSELATRAASSVNGVKKVVNILG